MFIKKGLLYFLLIVVVSACQNTAPEESKQVNLVQLNPEATVKKFQALIDNNNFPEAIQMSTPEMKKILSSLSELFEEDSDESGLTQTTFLQISCKMKENTTVCNCNLRDEYEDYAATFFLKKIKSTWLIDRTEDRYSEEDDESTIFNTEEAIK